MAVTGGGQSTGGGERRGMGGTGFGRGTEGGIEPRERREGMEKGGWRRLGAAGGITFIGRALAPVARQAAGLLRRWGPAAAQRRRSSPRARARFRGSPRSFIPRSPAAVQPRSPGGPGARPPRGSERGGSGAASPERRRGERSIYGLTPDARRAILGPIRRLES